MLDIWQRINGSELGGERQARFLASPALGDLVQFPADVLWERGRRLYQAHGRLLLNEPLFILVCAGQGLFDRLRGCLGRWLVAVPGPGLVVRVLAAADGNDPGG